MNSAILTALRWLDQNLEKVILIVAFAFCAGIVAVEVFRRYAFSLQAPWSTYIPAYLFLWLTWLGCSYAVKLRSHLNFNEIRERLPRRWQFVVMQIDYLLYLVFGVVVIYWSFDLVQLHFNISSIVPGTDNIPSWWFYSATPVGWTLLLIRVVQNVIVDIRDLRSGAPLKIHGTALATD